ncbi:hypothetical protein D9M72_615400 [compost metagenome]
MQDPGADQRGDGAERHQSAEIVVGKAHGAAGIVVYDQQDEPNGQDRQQDGETGHASPRSLAMRLRRVSRRGLRSTISSRSGSVVMIARRSASV